MSVTLLEQFLEEECTPHVCRLLWASLDEAARATTRFEFNRFVVTVDREQGVVLLEDDLDTTDAGALQVPIRELRAALAGVSPPTPWFKSVFEYDGVRIMLVVPELDVAWKQFEAFRDGVWEDAHRKNDWRIANAGFALELRSDEQAAESWKELLVDGADDVGLYVVTTAQQQIVGMLQFRKSERAVCYSRVLYRRREHRGGVDPVRVFQVVEEWLRASGIDEMTTGKIEGGDAARNHLKACGFELFSNAGGEFGRKVLTAANPPESR